MGDLLKALAGAGGVSLPERVTLVDQSGGILARAWVVAERAIDGFVAEQAAINRSAL